VRDLTTGANVLVSRDIYGYAATIDSTASITLSTDGRVAVFASTGSNLVPAQPGDPSRRRHLFWHDLQAGTTVRVTPADVQLSGWFACSADGRTVAYDPTSSFGDLVVWEAATQSHRVFVFSQLSTGCQPDPASIPLGGQLSGDGNVVFYFIAVETGYELRALDLQSERVEVIGHAAISSAGPPSISSDGRWVAYVTSALPSFADDHNDASDNAQSIASPQSLPCDYERRPDRRPERASSCHTSALTDAGLFFASTASDLLENEANEQPDVFLCTARGKVNC